MSILQSLVVGQTFATYNDIVETIKAERKQDNVVFRKGRSQTITGAM